MALICLVMIGAAVGGTMAWLSANANVENVVTIGNVAVEVKEPSWKPNPVIAPGSTIPKDPRVQNTGKNPCYVRMRYELSDGALANDLEINAPGENWVLVNDGTTDWYYYTGGAAGVLAVNAQTTPLFTSVKLKDSYVEANVTTFQLNVYTEAIQSENMSIDTSKDLATQIAALFKTFNS